MNSIALVGLELLVKVGVWSKALLWVLLCAPACPQSGAEQLIAQGHYNRARPLVLAVLEKHPQEPAALVALSTIQWAFGQLDGATATAERAVASAEGSASVHAQLLNVLGAKLASSRIGSFEKLGIARRFRKEAERTLQLEPRNLYAHEALARFYWYAPALGGGSKGKSREWLNKLVQLDTPRGYALKAELDATDSAKGRCSPTVYADWQSAAAASPPSYDAHIGLATCLLQAGASQLKSAEDAARKALALNPLRVDAYRLLATMYVASARWEQLDLLLTRARIAVPDDLAPEFAAAQGILEYNVSTQLPRAEGYLRDYLRQPADGLEPTQAMAHWRLGNVLKWQGRKSAAIAELEMALRMDASLEEAKVELRNLR
jgi:tetratricopeptide (TPR) repeat protein